MKNIDKSKPVLVTGASGFIAGWLVKKLLEEGLTVHAAVRDPQKTDKLKHLNEIADKSPGSIKYYKSDLLVEGSYAEGMTGCSVVFHTASPFITDVKDPQRDLIDPAEKGTANVLQSAIETPSVQRVVVTSSCAAIYTDCTDCEKAPGGILNESIWNTSASLEYQPYYYSKTLAEKKAWEINKGQSQWDLVTINPSLVLGPPLNLRASNSESFRILKQFGDGTMKMGAPKLGMGLVDVRDVAEAHFRAGFWSEAEGRYITSAYNTNLLEMGQTLLDKYGSQYPIPKKALPKWLLLIVGPLIDKMLSRTFIRRNVNVPWKADNSKIKDELKMNFRPIKETMEDTFQVLIDEGII